TTLASFKAYAGVEGNADDAVISSLISAYSAYVQQWLNRNILSQSYTDSFNGRDHIAQMLPQWPVTAVSAVVVDGISIPARAVIGQ
ncbi:head-tail connector protein, partial [Acinetobacter baumannii]